MVIISFPDGSDWYKANWAFRQLAGDVAEVFPEDAEVSSLMEKGGAFGHLDLKSMETEVASRITRAMALVAQQTLEGTIEVWKKTHPADEDRQRMYLESISELLSLINRQRPS